MILLCAPARIPLKAVSLLLLLCSTRVFLASPQPPPFDRQEAFYTELLLRSSRLHGRIQKHGMVPAARWDQRLFNESLFQAWLRQQVGLFACSTMTAGNSHAPCAHFAAWRCAAGHISMARSTHKHELPEHRQQHFCAQPWPAKDNSCASQGASKHQQPPRSDQ